MPRGAKDLYLKMKLYLLIRFVYADSGESYKSIKGNSTEKMSKRLEQRFHKIRHLVGRYIHEKMLTSLVLKGKCKLKPH